VIELIYIKWFLESQPSLIKAASITEIIFKIAAVNDKQNKFFVRKKKQTQKRFGGKFEKSQKSICKHVMGRD